MKKLEKLIFEKSVQGSGTYRVSTSNSGAIINEIPDNLKRQDFDFPEVPENEVMRHFLKLSRLNFCVDEGFYPLGSCTMKYNPKINERVASLEGFNELHPLVPMDKCQGSLRLMYELSDYLKEILGMDSVSLQPVAGASGEMTGLKIIREYHKVKGNLHKKIIIMPDSAHGTNPASAMMAGFEVREVKSNDRGGVDIENLKSVIDDNVAGFMVTNPNTLGLYDENIEEIAALFHEKDALLYYDGANFNAIMGKVKPGDMGFDIVHLNLHKTFATPHGGGGPGAGPVGVKSKLSNFLPVPVISKKDNKYILDYSLQNSIGKVHAFYGNFAVLIKAYTYIRMLGKDGLRKSSEYAVLNANYIMERLKDKYSVPYKRTCMHEFVISAKKIKKETGISAMDIAKALLDKGYHAPTMYFPLIVEEALMIEPTETETLTTLDEFCQAMIEIYNMCYNNAEEMHSMPKNTPITRVDDVKAARNPKINYYKAKL
ncbi:MAG: aminomethyl-transferring glycine dehydrogenase subunit GcvPB [Candidatus Muirbacterium halophilum]|nr:aminomethyl-transferring glycine dehydrogenase subunit GcvPB [Candidatus Muirbacterium halophilum]MCK9474688.1 aminomethyl-transferring glycine dehydrogenase subunit GcvPB [Candidatus Muirbacterium halophilum]